MAKMKAGGYAFLGLLALVVLFSFAPTLLGIWGPVLAIGFAGVVAIMNISEAESVKTLLAAFVLAVGGTAAISTALQGIPGLGPILASLLTNMGLYFLSIGLFVALKTIATRGMK